MIKEPPNSCNRILVRPSALMVDSARIVHFDRTIKANRDSNVVIRTSL